MQGIGLTVPEVRRVLALAEAVQRSIELLILEPRKWERGDAPSDVLEAILVGVVENVAEPRVRVEFEHGDVRVRTREGGDVGRERGVVVEDVLAVERGVRGAEVRGGTLERRDVEEEVRAAQVVGVCVFLKGVRDEMSCVPGSVSVGVVIDGE